MEKYLIKEKRASSEQQSVGDIPSGRSHDETCETSENIILETMSSSSKKVRLEFDPNNLISDPELRQPIANFIFNDQDRVRRAYLQKGPCQPRGHDFPYTEFGKTKRRFNSNWFNEHTDWLEYSIVKNAAFCLYCYVFPEKGADPAFITRGFTYWKDKKRLDNHVGDQCSIHNIARRKCEVLMNEKQQISVALCKQSDETRNKYRTRLLASVNCIRFLLHQGLAFRGHDESDESSNQGNFLELLKFHACHNDDVKNVVLHNAPENLKLISPSIQKDIVNAIASLSTREIVKDIGDDVFSVLVDESRDVSTKEQMVVVLRYVNIKGEIIERFLGLVHVGETTSLTLKAGIDVLFTKFGLSISKLRGQGYDGASNMSGEFNGLKTLIMAENPCAFYIHCFAHQLQLILVAVASHHRDVVSLFESVSIVMNCVGASCKRRDVLRAKEAERIASGLECGDIESGQGLNQELGIRRAGDTRWGSHYGALLNLTHMFSSIVSVLDVVNNDGSDRKQRALANVMLKTIQTFDFVFILFLMKNILGKTNELSEALQRKDQDIVNAIHLVQLSKKQLNNLRNEDNEWKAFLEEVFSFCTSHEIEIIDMNDTFVAPGRSRRRQEENTNIHHYRYEVFNTVIDSLLSELDDRFNEKNTELLMHVACLDPSDDFASFNKQKLIELARLYPSDFSPMDVLRLESQLDTYILDMRSQPEFSQVKGISELAMKLVKLKKDRVYFLVYRLLKLALLLPVATASVERVFSAMNIIKNRLRNKLGDEFMNDCLVAYIERDVVDEISNETIMEHFQSMSSRRGIL